MEAVFLFPWILSFVDLGVTAYYEMLVFILVLGAGLGYAWKKGALQLLQASPMPDPSLVLPLRLCRQRYRNKRSDGQHSDDQHKNGCRNS